MNDATSGQPVLSICVPTYNRSQSLRNLLRNLVVVKDRFGDAVEICISDNCSTDDSAGVIAEFERNLKPTVVFQASNIGGTRNIIAVAQLGRGRWNILVGDDDELLPDNLGLLVECLEGMPDGDWVLVGVANIEGHEHILGDLQAGSHEKSAFRRTIFGTSLHRYGFMGMHVFPSSARTTLAKLTLSQAQPWPHIAAFLRELDAGCVHVFRPAVMVQAKGGAKLFWSAADLARITLSKIRILALANVDVPEHALFHWALMLRELYSLPNAGLLLAWKVYEPEDYNETAISSYGGAYRLVGPLLPLVLPHAILVLLLRVLPRRLLAGLLRAVGKGHYLTRYDRRKSDLGSFDGIKRGI